MPATYTIALQAGAYQSTQWQSYVGDDEWSAYKRAQYAGYALGHALLILALEA